MAALLPYEVRYKAGTDKAIRPGVHGRFATLEQAMNGMEQAARYFGGPFKKHDEGLSGRALIWIVTDQAAVKALEDPPDNCPISSDDGVEEQTVEDLRAEIARLQQEARDKACADEPDQGSESTSKQGSLRKSLATSSSEAE